MESTVVNSYRAGINRVQGTILGAIIGMVFSTIKRSSPFLCALGAIIIIVVCNKFKWKKAIVISNTVFLAIMINLTSKTPLEYSFFRILDTILGIVISVLVNYLIFAPKLHERILEVRDEINNNIISKFREIYENREIKNLEDLRALINNYESLVTSLEEERVIYHGEDPDLDSFSALIKSYEIIFIYLEALLLLNKDMCYLLKENALGISSLIGEVYLEAPSKELERTEENIIFNYNIKKALETFKLCC